MKKILFTLTVLLLVAVFGVSAFMVGSYLIEGKKDKENFEQLSQIAHGTATKPTDASVPDTSVSETDGSEPTETTQDTTPTEPTEPAILEGLEELHEMNSDMVGWLKIDGTVIDYPVMQTPNHVSYYLRKNFYGDYSTAGCIFAWEKASITEPSDNVTLFGHNMANGTMFADLHLYIQKDHWEKYPLVYFHTLREYHTYEIFAVFETSADLGEGFSYHQFVDAANEEEFNAFVAECKRLSYYDTGLTPKYGDKLLSLSTCINSPANDRLVVVAYRLV